MRAIFGWSIFLDWRSNTVGQGFLTKILFNSRKVVSLVPSVGKKATAILVLVTLFILSIESGLCSESPPDATSGNWVEVTRFTGLGYQQYYTDYFTCDYREWRIRWEYIPEPDSAGFAYFNVIVYPERALFVVDSILSTGGNDTSGSYIHDMSGMFFMEITAGAAESYTIIVEQDLNSIPEFPSWAPLMITLISSVAVTVVIRYKLKKQRRFDVT